VVTWLTRAGFYDQPRSVLTSPEARLIANLQSTGAGGGRDLHFRVLQTMGVRLAGHLAGVSGHRASFADDLANSVAFGDARYADMRKIVADQFGADAPEMPEQPPFRYDPVLEVDLHGFGAVIITSGFRPDYRGWVPSGLRSASAFRSPVTT
jgi:putative flavoprotein involved in K+ transport